MLTEIKISDIANLLNAKVLSGQHLVNNIVSYGFASDLMSDVLTINVDNLVVITGLCNIQVIRTAEVSDVSCIIIVRNKKVTKEMLDIAIKADIVVMECSYSMFKASGILYNSGLKPVY